MKSYTLIFLALFIQSSIYSQQNQQSINENPDTGQKGNDTIPVKNIQPIDDILNFETWFMPGLCYTIYQPEANDSLGVFNGISVEYLIYAQAHQNDKPGPSHVRIYAKLNILNSDKSDAGSIFMYSFGFDLSLEKNPKRTFLIPYFGLETGGFSQKQLGSTFHFTPTIGMHILSRKNLFINIQGGYIYPVTNFEMLQGWSAQLGVNFAMW